MNEKRLEAFEKMLENIQREHDSIQRQMDGLKDQGENEICHVQTAYGTEDDVSEHAWHVRSIRFT